MIVRCGQCGTEFGLDERQIGPEGMPVRCSVCKNVFRVELAPPKPVPWQVETTDGTRFTAATLNTLREWIEEGRLHPDDKVSRTGNKWVRLGDMPEFAAAFEGFVDLPPVVKQVKPVRVEVGSSVRPIARGPEPVIPPISRRPDAMPPTPVRGTTNPELEVDEEPTSVRPALSAAPSPLRGGAAAPVPAPAPARELAPTPAPTPAPASGAIGDDDRTMAMARPVAMAAPVVERTSTRDVLPEPTRTPVQRPTSDALDDFEVAPRRRAIGPGLVVFLAAIAGLGVVFGVPSIRDEVLGGASPSEPAAPEPAPAAEPVAVPELAEARGAIDRLGLAELAKAEAALQPRLGESLDAETSTRVKVALAELRLTRALAYEVAAVLDDAQRETYRARALEDRNDGERIVDGLEGAPQVEGLSEVRALARLAAGRDLVEVQAMVPAGARELELFVQASPLWRDPAAKVPEGLVAGLSDLGESRGLAEGVLALALVRANDETAARNVLERLLVRADDSIVGKALEVRLGGPLEPGTDTAGADTAGTDVAKAPPGPDAGEPEPTTTGTGGGGGGEGGMTRFEKLVESGCSKVHGGSADEGIDILLKAFDDRPNDLDVLVCLADGYGKQGNNGRAADFYERALKQSPKFKPALIGAARVAAKTSATTRATKLYETLLLVDPDNAEAKEFLAKQGGGEPEPEPKPEPETPSPSPTPGG